MKLLILGGDGMLGHQLLESLASRHAVRATLRGPASDYTNSNRFNRQRDLFGVQATDESQLRQILHDIQPDALINCIGVVKQRDTAASARISIEVNALFPHVLYQQCQSVGTRLIHLSTDCVFSGRRGDYRESDFADANDLYGRTKFLGEIGGEGALTLRTSIIGLEVKNFASLIEWYLAQRGEIRGFTNAIYSGFTTLEMARIIERVLIHAPTLSGVYQVASEPISKHALLTRLTELLGRKDVQITPDPSFRCDRSLDGEAFCRATGYSAPHWQEMLKELAEQIRARGGLGP